MYLQTIIAFALVFFRSDLVEGGFRNPAGGDLDGRLFWGVQMTLLAIATIISTRRLLRDIDHDPDRIHRAQIRHHRQLAALRFFVFGSFAVSLYLTSWPDYCYGLNLAPGLRILSDLLVLSGYLLGHIVIWFFSYPGERALRRMFGGLDGLAADSTPRKHPRLHHVVFQFRHHVLIVCVPMLLILHAANLIRGHADRIREILWGWPFAPDLTLGVVAFGVFLIAPLLLRFVWTTRPLPAGPLRDRLERLCDRIGLKVREILVWRSDGLMINAAVMGLFRPVRYVLLSDGLMASMTPEQIEAVFGHEAGHVKHRHIEFFLLFALAAMLAVGGVGELFLAYWPRASAWSVEMLGALATLVLWGIGFGFISRRFERQADLFGARCVTPDPEHCRLPCSLHLQAAASTVNTDAESGRPDDAESNDPADARPDADPQRPQADVAPQSATGTTRVCATGASLFVSALDRVAMLNGIGHEERSWRHSSIGSRMRFLMSLANDPARAARFDRTLRRIRRLLLAATVVGGAFALYYYLRWEPHLLQRTLAAGT